MTACPKPTRAKKKKRKKLTPFPTLIKKANKVFNKFIRERDGQCVTCGTRNDLTCSHLITSGKKSVRYDTTNCNCQCKSHNFQHEWNPEIYTAWWINKYGLTAYNELIARSNMIKKFTREELEKIIIAYS